MSHKVTISMTVTIAIFASGFVLAYFGIFRDAVRTIDGCSIPTRHYYLAPLIFANRFSYGDYRDPQFDPSIPLMICSCHNNDKAGYEKLIAQTTTDQVFAIVCSAPPPAPYYQRLN